MLQWLKGIAEKRRLAVSAWEAAWRDAGLLGSDGLTDFQRLLISQLEPVTGPLSLRSDPKVDYLVGPIPGTEATLYVYAQEAQIHAKAKRFIAEHWDYPTPQHLSARIVAVTLEYLQSNPRLERP
jgi:hypothetical protein